jgi:hyperosmotically inducible protein
MLALICAALLLGAAGCSDERGGKTVGQKIDSGMDTAKDKLAESSDSAKDKLAESSDALKNGTEKAATAVEDAAITTKVKAEILRDPALKLTDINVETNQGIVILSGMVDKPQDAERAVRIARAVGDVKSVENKLAVRSTS